MKAQLILDSLIAIRDRKLPYFIPVHFNMLDFAHAEFAWDEDEEVTTGHMCGTTCCIGGAIVLYHDKPELRSDPSVKYNPFRLASGESFGERAATIADLTIDQAGTIFYGGWPAEYKPATDADLGDLTLHDAIRLFTDIVNGKIGLDPAGNWYKPVPYEPMDDNPDVPF